MGTSTGWRLPAKTGSEQSKAKRQYHLIIMQTDMQNEHANRHAKQTCKTNMKQTSSVEIQMRQPYLQTIHGALLDTKCLREQDFSDFEQVRYSKRYKRSSKLCVGTKRYWKGASKGIRGVPNYHGSIGLK